MQFDRRGFLKIAGLTALGLVAKPGWDVFSKIESSEPLPTPETFAKKKWGMAIELKKCWLEEGCKDCIDACHRIHNVPDLGTLKEEIKWIWTSPYGKIFPEHEFEYSGEEHRHKLIPILCNHCDDPPCVRYCPTRALHWMPILYGGLSLWVEKLQLERTPAFYQESQFRVSNQDQGGC
jgi:molybdopterin-containing oxidoreductase family iron-sulfur binding subunit